MSRESNKGGWQVGALCLALSAVTACAQSSSWETHATAGEAAYEQGRYAEAEVQLKAALQEAESFEPDDPRLAQSLNNLGLLYEAQGKYAEAEPLYQRALGIWEKALGPDHPNAATSLENYAALLRKTDREAEAAKMEARAKAIRNRHATGNPTK